MRRRRLQLAAVVAVLGLLGVVAAAVAGGGNRDVREHLTGYEEVAAARLDHCGVRRLQGQGAGQRIEYKLTYGGLEGDVLQAHIHLGAGAGSGGISVFLCSRPQATGRRARRPARRHAAAP